MSVGLRNAMHDLPFRSREECEALFQLWAAIGRFTHSFELMLSQLRSVKLELLRVNGLNDHLLASALLKEPAYRNIEQLKTLAAIQFGVGSDAYSGIVALAKRLHAIREDRNTVLHAPWFLELGTHPPSAGADDPKVNLPHLEHLELEARKAQVHLIRLGRALRNGPNAVVKALDSTA